MSKSFRSCEGEDLLGLPMSDAFIALRWDRDDCKVYFSAAQIGEAMTIHLSADLEGCKHLEDAVEDFMAYIFSEFKWCKMVLGLIEKRSVMRLAERCNFEHIGNYEHGKIYMRTR